MNSKYIFLTIILNLNLFSLEYVEDGFVIFSLSGDAMTHSIGGSPHRESMSLVNIYTLNDINFAIKDFKNGKMIRPLIKL